MTPFLTLSLCVYVCVCVWAWMGVERVTSEGGLVLETCVALHNLSRLDPVTQGDLQIELWIDNDRGTSQFSSSVMSIGTVFHLSREVLCWTHNTSNITDLLFRPLSAERIQMAINGDADQGYLKYEFPNMTGHSPTAWYEWREDNLTRVTNGVLVYEAWLQARAEKVKLSNRNWLTRRQCMDWWHACLLRAKKSKPTCISGTTVVTSDEDASAVIENTNKNTANRWNPTSDTGSMDQCWEPFQQYVTFETGGTPFAGIRIGTHSTALSTEATQGDDSVNPSYISIAVGDQTQSDTAHSGWQYWAVDLLDGRFTQVTDGIANSENPYYDIHPLWLYRDADPIQGNNRLSEFDTGYPEYYDANVNLHYKGSNVYNFGNWLSVVSTNGDSTTDDNADQIGQIAEVVCRQMTEDDTPSYEYTAFHDECWDTGDTATCDVFFPPLRFNYRGTHYEGCRFGSTDGITDLIDCNRGQPKLGDCDNNFANSTVCDENDNGDGHPLEFGCIVKTQFTSISPTSAPARPTWTPTRSPTNAPTTEMPTEFRCLSLSLSDIIDSLFSQSPLTVALGANRGTHEESFCVPVKGTLLFPIPNRDSLRVALKTHTGTH